MAWLRLYDDILDDPKIQMLSDKAFRALINLWCLAKRNGGKLPGDVKSLAFSLRWPEGKVRETLQALISAKLIDKTETGYEPHDWNVHQYQHDVSTERVKRFRERNVKRDETVSETSPDTDSEQIQTQKEETRSLRERSPRKAKTHIPDNFPDDNARRRAQEVWSKNGRPDLAASVVDEMTAFRDHHLATGKTSGDWAASWRTWVKNAPKFTPQQRMNGNGRRESPHRQSARIAAELIAEFEASNTDRDTHPHDGSGVVVLLEGPGGRSTEGHAQADVRGLGRKV